MGASPQTPGLAALRVPRGGGVDTDLTIMVFLSTN
jgi:hypothetical protein